MQDPRIMTTLGILLGFEFDEKATDEKKEQSSSSESMSNSKPTTNGTASSSSTSSSSASSVTSEQKEVVSMLPVLACSTWRHQLSCFIQEMIAF